MTNKPNKENIKKDDDDEDFTTVRYSDKQKWRCQKCGTICNSYPEYVQHYNNSH